MKDFLDCKNPFTARVVVDGTLKVRPLSDEEAKQAFLGGGAKNAWILEEDARGCFDPPKDFKPRPGERVSIVFEPLDCSKISFVGPCRPLSVVSVTEKP